MYCCLKRPSKSRTPVKEVLETFGGRAQDRESQSRLPSPSSVSSEAGNKNSNPAALVTVELDSNESEIGRFHGAVSTAKKLDELHLRLSDSNENEVTESEEVVPAVAQQGPLLRDGAISAVPKANKLDEVVPADAKQSRDLWKEAYAKLSKDKQDLLSKIVEHQGRSVVEKVTEQIEQSYCKLEGKRWKMASKKGFESALKSILKCKELISACLASDPTKHAAAAWTIVSLGLQMVQNNADLRDNVFQACGILAETLTLMAAVERSYRDRRVCDSDNLEDSIVGVYLAILELSAEIVFENSLNTGQRILNSFTALAEQPLQEFKRALTSEQEKMSRWTKIVEQQYRTQEGTEIGEKVESMFARIQGLAQQVSNIATRIHTEEEQRIFDWLSKYSFSGSQNSVAQRREPGTGAWILSLPEYKDWRTSDSSLLWLYGKCKYPSRQSYLY